MSSLKNELGVRRSPRLDGKRGTAERGNSFAPWLLLIGICMPTMQVFIGGAKFTPSRIAIILLLIPSLTKLFRQGRHAVASDYFVCLTASWMIIATTEAGTLNASAVAEVLEFLGCYTVVRAFVFGPVAMQTFIRVFKVVVFTLFLGAVLCVLFQQNIVQEIAASILPGVPHGDAFRNGWVRSLVNF